MLMPPPPLCELVPFDEVAAVLAAAAARVPGGPPAFIDASSRQLVAALDAAGFLVVRTAVAARQLTL